jgi:hypothetical protein
MRKIALALCLMGAPLAARAQVSVSPPASPPPTAVLDPARLAVARDLVAQMVTDTSMQRMFGGLDKVISAQMITAMVPTGDLAKARSTDPYLDERLKRVTKVSFDYLREIMIEVMPEMREVMATSFARKLSVDELRADLVFARTPAGKRLFESFYDVMQDPAYASFVQSFLGRFANTRTGLIDRIKAATADLPPPPQPVKKDDQ